MSPSLTSSLLTWILFGILFTSVHGQNALATLSPCPQCPQSIALSPITITAQFQPVSTCTPQTTCANNNCYLTASCSTFDFVSSSIPHFGGASSILVTKTDQVIELAHVSTVLTSLSPCPTARPAFNGTSPAIANGTCSTSTSYQTLIVDIVAAFNVLGPLALPNWRGSGLPGSDDKSQAVQVHRCLDNTCSYYPETWYLPSSSATSSSSSSVGFSSRYTGSSGLNTIPVTTTISPSGNPAYTAPVTTAFAVTTSLPRGQVIDVTLTLIVYFTAQFAPSVQTIGGSSFEGRYGGPGNAGPGNAGPGNGGDFGNGGFGSQGRPGYVTSTIYTTRTATVVYCPYDATYCPPRSTVFTTDTIVVTTTVYPATETSSTSTGPASTSASSTGSSSSASSSSSGIDSSATTAASRTDSGAVSSTPSVSSSSQGLSVSSSTSSNGVTDVLSQSTTDLSTTIVSTSPTDTGSQVSTSLPDSASDTTLTSAGTQTTPASSIESGATSATSQTDSGAVSSTSSVSSSGQGLSVSSSTSSSTGVTDSLSQSTTDFPTTGVSTSPTDTGSQLPTTVSGISSSTVASTDSQTTPVSSPTVSVPTTTATSSTSSSVPSLSPADTVGVYEAVGCFTSSDGFATFDFAGTYLTNTVDSCTAECKAENDVYAGISGTDCYCSPALSTGALVEVPCTQPSAAPARKYRPRAVGTNVVLSIYQFTPAVAAPTSTETSSPTTPISPDPSSDADAEPEKRNIQADMVTSQQKPRGHMNVRRGGMIRNPSKAEKAKPLNRRDYGLKALFGV